MQETSLLYDEILDSMYTVETRLAIGEPGVLINETGSSITFGGVSIRTAETEADGGFGENIIESLETKARIFNGDVPTVGDCISGEIDISMYKPVAPIPKMAKLVPYIRITDGTRYSEWIKKGIFYIDTRKKKEDGSSIQKIIIHGYDDMLKAEQDYPDSDMDWPAKDIDVVREIANFMNVPVDDRTIDIMKNGYIIQYPGGYSCREVLGFIASMYAGCFVMSDMGALRLVCFSNIPVPTNYLVTHRGHSITFGGVRILV